MVEVAVEPTGIFIAAVEQARATKKKWTGMDTPRSNISAVRVASFSPCRLGWPRPMTDVFEHALQPLVCPRRACLINLSITIAPQHLSSSQFYSRYEVLRACKFFYSHWLDLVHTFIYTVYCILYTVDSGFSRDPVTRVPPQRSTSTSLLL